MHESRMHESAWFLTLTYSDEEVPDNGSLDPRDFRAFVKAVRRDHEVKSIRYYGCGEYGESSQRPHYHAVLFGCDFMDRAHLRDSNSGPIWGSKTLDHYWGRGISEFGSVTNASAAYVAGYVRKKVSKKVYPEAYTRVNSLTGELVQIEKEFSRMSLKPAIGKEWIERFWGDVYPRDFIVMDGQEFKPPRYYDKWMDLDDDKGGARERRHTMMEVREKRITEALDVSNYTLQAREKIHTARVDLFSHRSKV